MKLKVQLINRSITIKRIMETLDYHPESRYVVDVVADVEIVEAIPASDIKKAIGLMKNKDDANILKELLEGRGFKK